MDHLRPALLLLFVLGCARSEDTLPPAVAPPPAPGKQEVAFIKTPPQVVDAMLDLAEIKPDDVVYDLGCGDARILVAAAKRYGVKAVGIDIDPDAIKEANENVRDARVEHLVTIKQGDIFAADFSDATVVMLYLLPELNVKLMPKLAKLPRGTRIVSHSFDMKGARPDRELTVLHKKIYRWVVPWKQQ